MDLTLNAQRFSGKQYIDTYDQYRPIPPAEIIQHALSYLGKSHADLIVDLGCGTGLSTLIWDGYADRIIGLEPSEEMLTCAKAKAAQKSDIQFLQHFANETPLAAASVDIVTCSQSFHWMEPHSTLKEINRMLKKDGVLVIYDATWPPSLNRASEEAYLQLFESVKHITQNLNEPIAHKFTKRKHFKNIKSSGYFHFLKEAYFHKTEKADLNQFAGIALSQGGLEALIKRGFSAEEIGIKIFLKQLDKIREEELGEMTYHYKVIYGIK